MAVMRSTLRKSRSRLRARALALSAVAVALLLLALLLAGTAWSHGKSAANVRAVVGPLPPELSGMRLEVHTTLSPQLVIENTTGRTVEVLDDAGIPFLRIGPKGVEGNLNARAWYLTYSPGAVVPATVSNGEPRWLRARNEPAFGWFEPRVDSAGVEVPHRAIDAGRAADVARWEVPMRVDGKPVALTGQFRYEPPPAGVYTSRLTSRPASDSGVSVTLLPGRMPGLLVENSSGRLLTVFGARGEPFLRVGPRGVEANVRSATWWESARSASGRAPSDGSDDEPQWRQVAQVPRFGWVEPRAAAPDGSAPADPPRGPVDLHSWQVPMQLGDEPMHVAGVVSWRPLERAK